MIKSNYFVFCLVLSVWNLFRGTRAEKEQEECRVDEQCLAPHASSSNSTVCIDSNGDCENWLRDGECDFNPEYMLKNCPKACGVCHLSQDEVKKLTARRIRIQKAGGNEKLLETPYGMSQFIFDDMEDYTTELFYNMSAYMDDVVEKDPKYDSTRDLCKNKHRECMKWKLEGECETNELWMSLNCAPVCETCLSLDINHRCPPPALDDAFISALQPGDLNKLFERIITHPYYKQFQPQVLSMPHNSTIHLDKSKVVDGPWIIVLDNFTTPEECDRIIELGTERGYEPSTSLRHGSEYQKRTSTLRTSFNTWCDTPKCNGDEATRRIHVKIENLTGIPERNSENLQLLRYELGQKCFVHNDYMEQHKDRRQGVRVLTVFLYLSDVPEGGETFFPDVGGIGVPPKKGRAVIWPSVRDDDPHAEDPRTGHGSSAVVSGIKYGANAFIHQRDAKSAYKWACF